MCSVLSWYHLEQERGYQDGHYKLIKEFDYPWDTRTREQKIHDAAIGFINQMIILSARFPDKNINEIHLKKIMQVTKCYSRDRLK